MNQNLYSREDIEMLRQMCAEKRTIAYMAEKLNRSEGSIRQKCKKLHLELDLERLYWSDEEIQQFKNDWEDSSISDAMLRKRYKNRSITAIKSQARRLNLGPREYDSSYLLVSDIVEEMKVSKDRVRGWIKKGLKYHKSRIKPYKYLIDEKELLAFLEQHPDVYDASIVSKYLFSNEPKWFKEKRITDKRDYNNTMGTKYTDEDFKIITKMFKQGCSNEEIAKAINRTPVSIEKMLWSMGLSRKSYNPYEIEIIKKHIDTHTIQEIADMLPLRTKKGIIAKCEQLGLKYHSKRKD